MLGHRLSEKFQLAAEEQWIINALSKIKNERNCLQIERLHLESLKFAMKPSKSSLTTPEVPSVDDDRPTTSVLELMQNTAAKGGEQKDTADRMALDDANVNQEELDLMVNNILYDINADVEMEEEEDDEEESDDEIMFIDMNLLMHGGTPK